MSRRLDDEAALVGISTFFDLEGESTDAAHAAPQRADPRGVTQTPDEFELHQLHELHEFEPIEAAEAAAAPGGGVHRNPSRRSRLCLLGVVLLALAGAAVAAYLLLSSTGGSTSNDPPTAGLSSAEYSGLTLHAYGTEPRRISAVASSAQRKSALASKVESALAPWSDHVSVSVTGDFDSPARIHVTLKAANDTLVAFKAALEDCKLIIAPAPGDTNIAVSERLVLSSPTLTTPCTLPVPAIVKSSPSPGEAEVALTRETFFNFDFPVSHPELHITTSLSVGGQPLPSRHHVSPSGTTLTVFPAAALPARSQVKVLVKITSNATSTADTVVFTTLNNLAVPGTSVCGRVFASEIGDGGLQKPLSNVTISVDGAGSLSVRTDSAGNFKLDPSPSGVFFVHIDGRSASSDQGYYPNVGKSWTAAPGVLTNIGNVFLPLVVEGTLQPVSMTRATEIKMAAATLQNHPEFSNVSISVPPDSLYANDGTRGGMVGIAPVPPDRLPGQLPPFLDFGIVITVQTDGATNFDVPAAACFPNLPTQKRPALEPGDKSALMSFNHDTGRFEVAGPMTVTDDGKLVCTDEGIGITAPGWHAQAPGSPPDDNQNCGDCCEEPKPPTEPTPPTSPTPPTPPTTPPTPTTTPPTPPTTPPTPTTTPPTPTTTPPTPTTTPPTTTTTTTTTAECRTHSDCSGSTCVCSSGKCVAPKVQSAWERALSLGKVGVDLGFCAADLVKGKFGQFLRCLSEIQGVAENIIELVTRVERLVNRKKTSTSEQTVKDVLVSIQLATERLCNLALPCAKNFPIVRLPLLALEVAECASSAIQDFVEASTCESSWRDFTRATNAVLQIINSKIQLYLGDGSSSTPSQLCTFVSNLLDHANSVVTEFLNADRRRSTEFEQALQNLTLSVTEVQRIADIYQNMSSLVSSVIELGDVSVKFQESANSQLLTTIRKVGASSRSPSLLYLITVIFDSIDASNLELRGSTVPTAFLGRVILPSDQQFLFEVYDPLTRRWAVAQSRTATAGRATTIPSVILQSGADLIDSDSDGLSDFAENVIGTDPSKADTDGDGILDGDEVDAGLNPLDGVALPTGVLAISDVADGNAQDVCAADDVVALALASGGIGLFNVFEGLEPLLMSRVLPSQGDSVTSVACGDSGVLVVGVAATELIIISGVGVEPVRLAIPIRRSAATTAAISGTTIFVGHAVGRISVASFEQTRGWGWSPIDLVLSSSAIQDLVSVGDVLFAITNSRLYRISATIVPTLLSETDITESGTSSRRISSDGQRLFVTFARGFSIFDLSGTLVRRADTGQATWAQVLPILADTLVAIRAGNGVEVYGTSSAQFVTRIPTGGQTRAAAVFNGLVYAVDSSVGLAVVNPVSVGVSSDPGFMLDVSSSGEAFPEAELTISAVASSRHPVRFVEFSLEHELSSTFRDASPPFQVRLRLPDTNRTSINVTVTAVSTAGNRITDQFQIEIPCNRDDSCNANVTGTIPADTDIYTGDIQVLLTRPLPLDTEVELELVLANCSTTLEEDCDFRKETTFSSFRNLLTFVLETPLADAVRGAYNATLTVKREGREMIRHKWLFKRGKELLCFERHQRYATFGAAMATSTRIQDDIFVFVPFWGSYGSTASSPVLKFNRETRFFEHDHELTVRGAVTSFFFDIAGSTYLVPSSFGDHNDDYSDTCVFRFNQTVQRFINTNNCVSLQGAHGAAGFQMGDDHLLGIFDYQAGSYAEFLIFSYEPTTSSFNMSSPALLHPFKGVAGGWLHFTIDGVHYILITSFGAGPSELLRSATGSVSNFTVHQSFGPAGATPAAISVDGRMYILMPRVSDDAQLLVFNNSSGLFEELQTFPAYEGYSAHAFSYNGEVYFTFSDRGSTSGSAVQCPILRFNRSTKLFEVQQTIATIGNHGLVTIDTGDTGLYLFASNWRNRGSFHVDSFFYRAVSKFVPQDSNDRCPPA